MDRIALCCLGDDAAFGRIQSACASLKLHAARITPAELTTKPLSGAVALFVYDLKCPEPQAAFDLVQQFQLCYPICPVFLYYRRTPVAVGLAGRLGQGLGVITRIQLPGTPDEVGELVRFIRRLVMHTPDVLFRTLTRVLLHQSPRDPIGRFVEGLLARFEAAEPGAPPVEQMARRTGLTPWRLRRACRNAPAPNPERLVEWLTLIYVLQLARQEALSVAGAAKRVGMDERHVRQLRARLMPDFPALRRPLIPHAVTHAIMRLGEECGLSRAQATGAVRQIVGGGAGEAD